MPEKTTSFETRNQIRIPLDSNTNTCERLRIARFGGQYHLIAIRNKTYDERDVAEIKIYDIDLNPGSGATC